MAKKPHHSQCGKRKFAKILENNIDVTILEINTNKAKYDIKVESKTGRIITFTVREDIRCKTTGNVLIEHRNKGIPAGIATTEADFYVTRCHRPGGIFNLIIKTSKIKEMIRNGEYDTYRHIESTGNSNFFFKFKNLEKVAEMIYMDPVKNPIMDLK